MNILELLKTKPHNLHYLNRYYRFMEYCGNSNINLDSDSNIYTEEHHIAPKSTNLFPEYASFRINPWNKIKLTSRQHIIAHVLLWKCYGRCQTKALDCMLGEFTRNNIDMFNRKIPTSIVTRYAAKIRDLSKGMSTYKDSNNNKYYLHRDDPKIVELNLVGNNEGHFHTEDTKEKQRRAKDHSRMTMMYKLDKRKNVKVQNQDEYINLGWNFEKTLGDIEYIAKESSRKKTEKMTGRSRWAYPDGMFHSFIKNDDPIIKELGLVPQVTDNSKAQYARRSKLAQEANTGSQFYNDGIVCKKFKINPGTPWVLGQLVRDRSAQILACASRKGKLSWNNGVTTTYAIESPGIEWKRGMAPRI